jgi:hypothetical protein
MLERKVQALEQLVESLAQHVDTEDVRARIKLAKITPSNEALLAFAKKKQPPQEWFEQPEERPW